MGVKMKFKNKKGQLAIFIIIALILVVVIILLFLLISQPDLSTPDTQNPNLYIEKCAKDSVKEAIEILLPRGGSIEPTNYKLYQDEKRTYLCSTNNFYERCIHQEPLLAEHIEKEITEYAKPRIEQCFLSLKQELESKNYAVEMGGMEVQTRLLPKKVEIEINRDFVIKKNDVEQRFKRFRGEIINPLYDLVVVALEIIKQEARFCNFERVGYMMFYPDYDIQKFSASDGSDVYTIKERASEEEFVFAVRSCVMPAGLVESK